MTVHSHRWHMQQFLKKSFLDLLNSTPHWHVDRQCLCTNVTGRGHLRLKFSEGYALLHPCFWHNIQGSLALALNKWSSKCNKMGMWWCARCTMESQQAWEFLVFLRLYWRRKNIVHTIEEGHATQGTGNQHDRKCEAIAGWSFCLWCVRHVQHSKRLCKFVVRGPKEVGT